MKVIEYSNLLTENEIKQFTGEDFWGNFPLYYGMDTTDSYNSYSAFSHTIVTRWKEEGKSTWEINSMKYYNIIKPLFDRFCLVTGIEYKYIYRMALNLTLYSPIEYFAAPHLDHEFRHKVALLYLNNCSGDTVLFKKELNSSTLHKANSLISEEITPEAGKMVAFNGQLYHANRPCSLEEYRLVCVITYG
jgi:hypothetical protein